MLEFGFSWYQWNHSQDNENYLESIPRYKRIKLKAINYKNVYSQGVLSAIQLEFTNHEASPWIGTGMSFQDKPQRIEIDTSKKIRKISMLVQGGFRFLGIRLVDDTGKVIVRKVWATADLTDSAWVTKEIDDGQEIIGLQAYTEKHKFCRLGWLLWEPKVPDRKIIVKKRVKQIALRKAYEFDAERRRASLESIRFNMSRTTSSMHGT